MFLTDFFMWGKWYSAYKKSITLLGFLYVLFESQWMQLGLLTMINCQNENGFIYLKYKYNAPKKWIAPSSQYSVQILLATTAACASVWIGLYEFCTTGHTLFLPCTAQAPLSFSGGLWVYSDLQVLPHTLGDWELDSDATLTLLFLSHSCELSAI